MALEPTAVPSRAGIQQAIDDAVPASVRRNTVAVTDGTGEAYFAFGITFDTVPIVVGNGGNGERVDIGTITTDGFTAHFTTAAGADIVAGYVRLLYIAMEAS